MLGAGGVMGGAWLTGGLRRSPRDRLGPGQRRLHRRHVGRLDDRRAPRGRHPAVVHGRPLARRGLRRPDGPGRPPGRRSRPLRRRDLPAPPRHPRHRPRLAAHGVHVAVAPAAAHAAPMVAGWLPAGFISTEPLKDTVAAPCRAAGPTTRTTGSSPATTRRGRRTPFGRAGSPARRPRRRRRRLVRDPGLLPPGHDRRPPLRRRRRLLDLEPRPRGGPRARPRDLPEPDPRAGRRSAARPRRGRGRHQRGDRLHPVAHPARLGARLEREERKVRRSAPRSCSIQPTAEDLDAMGAT